MINAYQYFHTYLPSFPTAEVSHLQSSMLHLPSNEEARDEDVSPAAFNGLTLDDIQENSKMINARPLQKIDIARKAVADGEAVKNKIKQNQKPSKNKSLSYKTTETDVPIAKS